jgi:hypothetical protein
VKGVGLRFGWAVVVAFAKAPMMVRVEKLGRGAHSLILSNISGRCSICTPTPLLLAAVRYV